MRFKMKEDDLADQFSGCILGILAQVFWGIVFGLTSLWGGLLETIGINPNSPFGTILKWLLAFGTVALFFYLFTEWL